MKQAIAIVILILLLAAGAWFFLFKKPAPRPSTSEQTAQTISDQLPDLNPAEKTNPFAGSYQNPFKQ